VFFITLPPSTSRSRPAGIEVMVNELTPELQIRKARLPISVCVIAGAEAHRLGRALASVADWTREIIVVVNEEVADGTDEVARKYGAQVFREPWKGFRDQKNSALAKATQPWVFALDADEAASPRLRQEIQELFKTAFSAENPAGFTMPRCSFYCGRWIRHGDWYPDRCLRLWQAGQGRWEGADPHPSVVIQGAVGQLRGDLEHYSMESINQQIQKTMVYADTFVGLWPAQRQVTRFDLACRPVWRFLRAYFFRGGFLDGWQGFSIAWLTAFYTFLRYVRVQETRDSSCPPHTTA
jgi:glycosyltransferase involved in cell wall biosynthesis